LQTAAPQDPAEAMAEELKRMQASHRRQLEELQRKQMAEMEALMGSKRQKRAHRDVPPPASHSDLSQAFPVGRVQSGLFLTAPAQAGLLQRGSDAGSLGHLGNFLDNFF